MLTKLFFPGVPGVRVERVFRQDQVIHLVAVTTGRSAACPLCGRRSRRVHSRYARTLADLPCAGDVVTVHVRARRFVCRRPTCPRRVFTERLPALAAPFARKTARLRAQLQDDGVALGGCPGARHATAEGKAVSARTLLRLVRALPLPPAGPLAVIGVDDWAKRKGRAYGTIVVDLERHRVVDLLPDRSADTLAVWLQANPGIVLASRDRAGAYADGIRRGSPGAVQVADRFHLLKNLVEAVERALDRHRPALKAAAVAVLRAQEATVTVATAVPPPPPGAPPAVPPAPLTADPRLAAARRARRLARDTEVLALHPQGATIRAIARQMQVTRKTVRRIVRAGAAGAAAGRALPAGTYRPFEPYLWQRWTAGCQNARLLWEEIRTRGYAGSCVHLRRALRTWRTAPAPRGRAARAGETAPAGPAPPQPRLLSPRQATWVLVRDPDALEADDRAFLEQLVATAPAVQDLRALAHAFRDLVRRRDVGALPAWLQAAERSAFPELRGFAGGLRRDIGAVTAALEWEWSNGQTEGHVNKLKLLKRAMYGRAKDDLLRLRLLHAA